jgi:hypothetical protein
VARLQGMEGVLGGPSDILGKKRRRYLTEEEIQTKKWLTSTLRQSVSILRQKRSFRERFYFWKCKV